MQIEHKETGKRGRFFIPGENEEVVAEIVYLNREPGTMIIEHTEVSEELQGKNIGYDLVHSAVEHARTNSLKIIALCSFANAVINRKPEFKDMLAD